MARPVTEIDRAIIRLLQRDARVSFAEISRATAVPESTVRRRIERLQQRGMIEFAVLAEPSRLGFDVRAMIGLKVELGALDRIGQTLRQMEEVAFAAFLTGRFDVVVHVVVESQAALVELLSTRVAAIDGVRAVETFVMPYVIKPTSAWVLPEGIPAAADGLGRQAAPPAVPADGQRAKAERGNRRVHRKGGPGRAADDRSRRAAGERA